MLPHEFIKKWTKANLKESAAAQEHFIDLCRLLEHPTPAEADADGSSFTFEKGAKKTAGGDGFADVWKKGFFAWEYKGKHKDLQAAYVQLQQYREDLENPPLLVVCDLDRFEIRTNFTNTVTAIHRCSTADLDKPETLTLLRNVFTNPEALRPGQTITGLTEEAARQFARVADMLRARDIDPHKAAHFLVKLVFCFFAEDVGLLPERHFSRIVERTVEKPAEFVSYTRTLFQAMAKGGSSLLEDIAYFNGNLFADAEVIELTPQELAVVRDAGKFNWSEVEPAIFGTLFERSLDPSKRSQIGAHYTHPDDIRAVVEPVVMTPLRREWEEVRAKAAALNEKRRAAAGRTAQRLMQQVNAELRGFLSRLAGVRVLDPACGSGNFLYISMNLLKDLEKEVITFAGHLGLTMPLYEVTPEQLHGIEINPYARELAQTAVWIGYIQWHRKHGFPVKSNPVLSPLDTIREADAVLDLSDPDNPKEPDWPDADFIVGNPPFLGGKLLRTHLGDQYVDRLFTVYDGRVTREADLCVYWFEKARAMLEAGRVQRAGLLATQGIRGGGNRRVLERIRETGDIFLAYSDREWVLEGAAVHVSIVGFDNGSEAHRMLDGQAVAAINANLTMGLDLTKAKRLKENLGISFMGDTKGGAFDIPEEVALAMLKQSNPDGRPNSDVVRPWVNGLDVTRRPRNMWIVDFGTDMPVEQAALYEAPFEYLKEHVQPDRLRQDDEGRFVVRRQAYRERWWLHMEPRVDMREELTGKSRFLATPTLAKHRLLGWLESSTLADHQLIVIARDDDYTFGVLHSHVHETWALAMGTQLEDRPRYTPSTTFETFPFPWPLNTPDDHLPSKQRAHRDAIADAARDLDRLRQGWLNPEG
ncbi:MAG: DNA methyltransferase, partial [Dehalococcoidia bacterium]